MKKTIAVLAILAFVAAGAAQAVGGELPNQTDNTVPDNQTDDVPNDTEDEETDLDEVNETEEAENASDNSAQFQARLNVAINTLNAIEDIAPNDEARAGIQDALESLTEVQSDTGGAPGNQPEEVENETDEENESQEETGQRGPPEGQGPSGVPGEGNSNRPGFVSQMLSGIFG